MIAEEFCCGLFIVSASASVTMLQMKPFRERRMWQVRMDYSSRFSQTWISPSTERGSVDEAATGDFTLSERGWKKERREIKRELCSLTDVVCRWESVCRWISGYSVTNFQLLITKKKRGARLQCLRASVCFSGLFPQHHKKRFRQWECV